MQTTPSCSLFYSRTTSRRGRRGWPTAYTRVAFSWYPVKPATPLWFEYQIISFYNINCIITIIKNFKDSLWLLRNVLTIFSNIKLFNIWCTLFVCMCVCVYVHMCIQEQMHTCICLWEAIGQSQVSSSVRLSILLLRQGLSLRSGGSSAMLHWLASAPPGIVMSISLQCWD